MSMVKADATPATSSGAPAARPAKPYEPEGQFILRLPEPVALLVKMALDNTTKNVLKDRLKIDMQAESRNAKVYVDSMEFSAKLVDLPCVVESLKTIDKKTFYKTGDVCQMLVVSGDEVVDKEPVDPKNQVRSDEINKDKRYQWPHGLTPPLKNVRKTRFRKTLKRKDAELQEIENELKRLLRADSEAVPGGVKYEIVYEDAAKDLNHSMSEAGDMESMMSGGDMSRNAFPKGLAEHDIFGEVLSSSEDEAEHVPDMTEENNLALDFME
ncbi:hypothetical protein RvY_05300 [Ramazzottius varieornatus]|uniref:TAFII55 protein conserved region domain-containing protein n=1 Tax=Ramazzottius varieornatus TaxID=947166 RepID=A0A1D1UUJ5_RAMVA|nr:hypothetical protein RvY_05300 [Ramazzottius varieornatus]